MYTLVTGESWTPITKDPDFQGFHIQQTKESKNTNSLTWYEESCTMKDTWWTSLYNGIVHPKEQMWHISVQCNHASWWTDDDDAQIHCRKDIYSLIPNLVRVLHLNLVDRKTSSKPNACVVDHCHTKLRQWVFTYLEGKGKRHNGCHYFW